MSCTEFAFRVLLSLCLGFCIGLERQLTGHSAGIRINVLICLGTSLFTLFPIVSGSDQTFRVASSIISGVGFLCSGVIFKENGSVRGMNTAATLWCSAAIGVLSTTGMVWIAVTAAFVLVVSNLILRPLTRRINPMGFGDESENEYRVSVTCQENAESEIRELLLNSTRRKSLLFLKNLDSSDVIGEKVEVIAEFSSMGKMQGQTLEEIVSKALKNNNVVSAGWEII